MRRGRAILLAGLGLAAAAARAEPDADWGFLWSRREDVLGRVRTTAAGPFYQATAYPDGSYARTVHPLIHRAWHEEAARTRNELLWPLAQWRTLEDDVSGRVLLAYWTVFDHTDDESRYRFWFLPIWFHGRDADGDGYMALFPVGGTLHEFLGRDRIVFVLFPLYAYSELETMRTHSVLWPIGSHTRGRGVEKFRVFPFYGRSRARDRHTRTFVMWPFWSAVRIHQPRNPGRAWMAWPFVGRVDTARESTWMFLPPIVRVTRSERQNAVRVWPFYESSEGERRAFQLWPVAGWVALPGESRWYALWPVAGGRTQDDGERLATQWRVLPFLSSWKAVPRSTPVDPDPEPEARFFSLWPLFKSYRQGEARQWTALNLWPQRTANPFDRNWGRLWTVVERIESEAGAELEVLWGLHRSSRHADGRRTWSLFPLYEHERHPETGRAWSVGKGLLGRRPGPDGASWRLLYIFRFGAPPPS